MARIVDKDAVLRARIPGKLKAAGDAVLKREGLSQSEAMRLIWQEMVRRDRFPFEIETRLRDAAE